MREGNPIIFSNKQVCTERDSFLLFGGGGRAGGHVVLVGGELKLFFFSSFELISRLEAIAKMVGKKKTSFENRFNVVFFFFASEQYSSSPPPQTY